MEVYQGVAMTDGLNRKNHFIPLSTILKAYRDTWDRTIPMNIGHDRTKPIGYTRLTGVYMEPGKAYVTNEGAIMETTEEHEMLRKMIEVNDYQQFCEAHRDEIDSLVGKLKDVITDSFRVAPIGQAVAIKDNDIVKRLFPEWINNFKDGLTDINELESVYSTTTDGEKGVLIPGVYFKDGYLLFAHQFFRRTLSILNSTNEEFFVSFEKLRDIPNLNVKVALDMDMVGLPGTEHPEIEYQYIRGPYFSEDLKLIPEGVTCYENEHYDNLFSNIVGTQFYWHKQDGTRTFECEELCDRENVSFDGGNTMLWGCRYVHSMLNPSTGLPTHLDGAIRLYNEENILERIDKKNDISKCGKNSKYIKLWRIDNDFSVSLWKELISSFYRENSLIGQYFGGIDEKYEQIKKEEEMILLAFNKPVGIVCTAAKDEKDNIVDYIHYPKRIYPVGRLDKDSQGLILLTNNGDIVNKMMRAGNMHEKEYEVTVNHDITETFLKKMSGGVPLEELGVVTRPCAVEKLDVRKFRIILTQGYNRQIRRMCEYCGYKVVKLKRVRIMNIELGSLKKGKYRRVTAEEWTELNRRILNSSNTTVMPK